MRIHTKSLVVLWDSWGFRMGIHTKSLVFLWDSCGSGWEFIQNHWFTSGIHGLPDEHSYKIIGFPVGFMGFRMRIHTKSLGGAL